MAAARVRQAFQEDESDEDAPHQMTSRRSSRRQPDSLDDEDATHQGIPQPRPLPSSGGRLKSMILRSEESGDLRPTTPPAGHKSHRSSRQAEWASAVFQMLQNTAVMKGKQIQGAEEFQKAGPGSVSSTASRRHRTPSLGITFQRPSAGHQPSSSTKVAASLRLPRHFSSDDEEGLPLAASVQSVGLGAPPYHNQQAPPAEHVRSSRLHTTSGFSTAADNASAPPPRFKGGGGRVPPAGATHDNSGGSGGLAAAAAAACDGLQGVGQRRQQPSSHLRRAFGNGSVVSEVSHPESLASTRQTLGSSKLSATVQRVIARQRLIDSSSGEDDGYVSQWRRHNENDVGKAGRILARFKSLSVSTSESGGSPAHRLPLPEGVLSTSSRKSAIAAVVMISAANAKSVASSTTAVARPSSAVGSARIRSQGPDCQAGPSGTFTFTNSMAPSSSGGLFGNGISPRMRQVVAAATAEVAAAAASSLQPLPLTTIVPAHFKSPDRPKITPQKAFREQQQHRASSMVCAVKEVGLAASAGVVAPRHAEATGTSQLVHVSNTQRIASWLAQQPSQPSVGFITDGIVSESATTLAGTEAYTKHPFSCAKASGRAAAGSNMESIVRGDVNLSGPGATDGPKKSSSRSRVVRLTVSSDEEDHSAVEHRKAVAMVIPIIAEERRNSRKQLSPQEGTVNRALAENVATRFSAGVTTDMQVATGNATALSPSVRRLEFTGPVAAQGSSPHLMKDHASTYSSPVRLRTAWGHLANSPPASYPSNGLHEAGAIVIKPSTARESSPAIPSRPAAATVKHGSVRTSASRHWQHEAESVDEQQTEANSSPESGVRSGSGPGAAGQLTRMLTTAAGGRLTTKELRVMLSVLSRPPWAGASAHGVASAVSPQPSRSGDSVQSFSYSEMLQVMRAMSSSGSGESQRSGSTRDGGGCAQTHKGGRNERSSDVASIPCVVPRPVQHLRTQYQQQQLRSAREISRTSTTHSGEDSRKARLFDDSSSLLGEHPMAAPLERHWSTAASAVSGCGYHHEEQQQRDFADVSRLWNALTGRHCAAESLQSINFQVATEAATVPVSGMPGPLSMQGSGSGTQPSAAALAASAAARSTSAVMATSGVAHIDTCVQAFNRQPFSNPVAASSVACEASQDVQHNLCSTLPAAAALSNAHSNLLTTTLSPAPAPSIQSLALPGIAAVNSFDSHNWQKHESDDDPAALQKDLMCLMHLLDAEGENAARQAEDSEASRGDVARLVQALLSGQQAVPGQDGGVSRPWAAPSLPEKRRLPIAPEPLTAARAVGSPGVLGTSLGSPRVSLPCSRRSTVDTMETGLAPTRLYQSLRDLRVREDGSQTEGTARHVAAASSSIQANPSDLQVPSGDGAGKSEVPGFGQPRSLPNPAISVRTSPHGDGAADGTKAAKQSQPSVPMELTPAALSGLVGKDLRVTRAVRLPSGQLVELDSLLALVTDEVARIEAAGDSRVGQFLQDLRAISTASTTPTWCTSPNTTEGGVRTDLIVQDLAAMLPSHHPLLQQSNTSTIAIHRLESHEAMLSEILRGLGSDSAAVQGTSITAAPAISPAEGFATDLGPPVRKPREGVAAAFSLRSLPIATEGGFMSAPRQETTTVGRVGSAGGMLAYLEEAEPTTATALLELVQALQLMTLHSRRRRWMSDGSSTASGVYLVDSLNHDSLGSSSAGATTLRYSFGTSIGPSVSQAGHTPVVGLPDDASSARNVSVVASILKAATFGGEELEGPQTKRQTHGSGVLQPSIPVDAEATAKHLRRALRAMSGGGTLRLSPSGLRQTIRGGGATAAKSNVSTPAVPVTEAAKIHMARALQLLSQPHDLVASAAAAAMAPAAEVELLVQEELVAALLALLTPGASSQATGSDMGIDEESAASSVEAMQLPMQQENEVTGEMSWVLATRTACETYPQNTGGAASSSPQLVQQSTTESQSSEPWKEGTAVRSASPSGNIKPSLSLQARIQEVLQQAERASASISSLQVGLSPTAPLAAEVLDGVPFEQAIGFIMDGLRDFDSGPSQLARHLHLMYSPSSAGVSYPTALGTLASRQKTGKGLSAATALEAVLENDSSASVRRPIASEASSDDAPFLTEADREHVKALVLEAVSTAEALSRVAAREEAWNTKRLGREDDPTIDKKGQQEEHDKEQQQSAAPTAQQLSASSPALSDNVTGIFRPQLSLPCSPTVGASSAGTTRCLIKKVTETGSVAMASLFPDVGLIEHRAGANSIQRSAPVSIGGMSSLSETAIVTSGVEGEPASYHGHQTFGGPLSLSKDSDAESAVLQGVPDLPYGGLDEQLRPIQPGHQAGAQVARAAVRRLPTFATPLTPAVRGTPMSAQSASTGGTVQTVASSTVAEHLFASAHSVLSVPLLQEQECQAGSYNGGWGSDVASAARTFSPEPGLGVARVAPAPCKTPDLSASPQLSPRAVIQTSITTIPDEDPSLYPEVPILTARDRFKSPRPTDTLSAYADELPEQLAAATVCSSPMVTGPVITDAGARIIAETAPAASVEVLSQRPSPWPPRSGARGGCSSVCLARDVLGVRRTGRVADEVAMKQLWESPMAAPAGDRRSTGGSNMGEAEVVDSNQTPSSLFATAPEHSEEMPAAADAAVEPTEQLLSQAAEVLQGMQRAAEGQPEQEAAFHVLAPFLKGLAATAESEQPLIDTQQQSQQFSNPRCIQQPVPTVDPPLVAQAVTTKVESDANEFGGLGDGEANCGPSLTFSQVTAVLPQRQEPQGPQVGLPSPDVDSQELHLATAADLENFKEDVMAGVRSALIQIVDMIGSAVTHRALDTCSQGAGDEGKGLQLPPSYVTGQEASEIPMTPRDPDMTPERSLSPLLAPEQREIRITRAELEAFIFGKAVLGRTVAADLLGVRLRELYTPHVPQKQDDDQELTQGYNAVSNISKSSQALGDRDDGGIITSAPVTAAASARFDQHQRVGSSETPTCLRSPCVRHDAGNLGFSSGLDTSEQDAVCTSSHVAIPRDSPLRQPLSEGADFKSLFRSSVTHLCDHLQPTETDARLVTPAACTELHHGSPTALISRATAPQSAIAAEPPLGFEATFSTAVSKPTTVWHIAKAGIASGSNGSQRLASAPNDDDVELDSHLTAGLEPEPDVARCPDPVAPAAQQPQSRGQSQAQHHHGTADSNAEVGAIGDFLAALAEPIIQAVGVLTQSSSSSRFQLKRSIVIEELPEDQSQPQHPPLQRSSRVAGFVAATSDGNILIDAHDEREFGSASVGDASQQHRSTHGAMGAYSNRLHLGQPTRTDQHLHATCSASSSSSPNVQPTTSVRPIEHSSSTWSPTTKAHVQSQAVHEGASLPKMVSTPGRDSYPFEDRPLSSFVSPSEAGGSPPHRRTHIPGPLGRQATLRSEASVASSFSAMGVYAPRSVDVPLASPPVTSLDELESSIRAFRTRIGTDEPGMESVAAAETAVIPIQQQHLALQCESAGGSKSTIVDIELATHHHLDTVRHHVIPGLAVESIAEEEGMCRDSILSESISIDSARRVTTGFNMFTIRASAASAAAAAAAVEEAFSPRPKRERTLELAVAATVGTSAFEKETMMRSETVVTQQQLQPQLQPVQEVAAVDHLGAGNTVRSSAEDTGSGLSCLTDASHGSSSVIPTSPLLRDHLEHFQALLEKANDLVDRLMLPDEESLSHGGMADSAVTLSPLSTTPLSGSGTRRQLTYQLVPQKSGSVASTPQRNAVVMPMSAWTPNTLSDGCAEAVPATPLPAVPFLDPELVALFPATAARLARPHGHIEQSPDAANSLLSLAVEAVPQLAKGAGSINSIDSSPLSGSYSISPGTGASAGHRPSVPAVPTPAQSIGVATPLALVASLLAEAHSRMEFHSLEEQRGADRILSAVLDEHFAQVLGTPRGFLTMQSGSIPRVFTSAVTSPLTTPYDTSLCQQSAAGTTSGGFGAALSASVEANTQVSDTAVGLLQPIVQQREALELNDSPQGTARLREATGPSPSRGTGQEGQLPFEQRQSSQERHEDMSTLLTEMMRQRSDILSSALDHVQRAGLQSLPPPPVAGATPVVAPNAFAHLTGYDIHEPYAIPLPPAAFTATESDSTNSPTVAYLPSSAIPGASDGLAQTPQPLMPYQELDSESTPTSFTVSVADSNFHPDSTQWSRGPSPRTTGMCPIPSGSQHPARRVLAVVSASNAELLPGGVTVNAHRATSDSAILPEPAVGEVITAMLVRPAEAMVQPHSGFDLSHLIDDDDSTSSTGPSSVFQRSALAFTPHIDVAYDGSSGVASTLRSASTLDGSRDHYPSIRQLPHETSLRFNPVYDPTGASLGGGCTGTAFDAVATAAAVSELSGTLSDGGAAASGITMLHHEATYTPLALAAAGASDGGAGPLTMILHTRLRSAGGTSTAVLVPNPMFDDSADQSPAMVAAAHALAQQQIFSVSGAPSVDSCNIALCVKTPGSYPRRQLDFTNGSGSSPVQCCAACKPSNYNVRAALSMPPVNAAVIPALNAIVLNAARGMDLSSKDAQLSDMMPADDAPDSGDTSTDLSSLLANSLTESQLNLLSAAPELPNSRRQSSAFPLQQQLHVLQQQKLSYGGGLSGLTMARAPRATAGLLATGGIGDVTASVDFEEISREAAAVADTLSAHASFEAVSPEDAAAVPHVIAQAPSTATAPFVVPKLSAQSIEGKHPSLWPPASMTPVQKRHMSDMVAVAGRRFELGFASAPAESVLSLAAVANTASAAFPEAIQNMAMTSLSTGAGASADWHTVSLCTGGGLLSRQISGVEASGTHQTTSSGLVSMAFCESLPTRATAAEFELNEVSLVHTRERLPPSGCQEISDELRMEQGVAAACKESNSLTGKNVQRDQPQEHGDTNNYGVVALPAPISSSNRTIGRCRARQSESPALPARRTTVAFGSSVPSNSVGGNTTARALNYVGSQQQSRAPSAVATVATACANSWQPSPARVRSAASSSSAGTGSPRSYRSASASGTVVGCTARRSTQSPSRTASVPRVTASSAPGSRVATGSAAGTTAAQRKLLHEAVQEPRTVVED